MKKIIIPYLDSGSKPGDIPAQMISIDRHLVNTVNWPGFPYTPEVDFSIAWTEENIYLKYFVKEKSIMALTGTDNGPVWKDSCVEFFVSPGSDDYYYNFEFNCIGTCLLAFGNSRHDREFGPSEIMSLVIRVPSLERKTFPVRAGNYSWELFAVIPAKSFFRHPGYRFRKGSLTANFYKCGDSLPTPHFLTWNPVITPEPDYHQPRFFGILELLSSAESNGITARRTGKDSN